MIKYNHAGSLRDRYDAFYGIEGGTIWTGDIWALHTSSARVFSNNTICDAGIFIKV